MSSQPDEQCILPGPERVMAMGPEAMVDLVTRARGGERLSLARLVTVLETGSDDLAAVMAAMIPHFGGAPVIGFTGPPGAGKSTLVDALIRCLRISGARVAVIAVDPSSPVSGGAILGDRVRMTAALDDDNVFVRSLASRGALGGLSPAAVRMIDGFDAAGFTHILIETVGTGQNEVDVAAVADVKVVLAAPGLGDGVQAMKAGLLEIADVLVVNKADLVGADATVMQLKAAQALSTRNDAIPVLKTVAATGVGLDALVAAIDAAVARNPLSLSMRRERRAAYVLRAAVFDRLAAALEDGQRAGLVADLASGRIALPDAVGRVLKAL